MFRDKNNNAREADTNLHRLGVLLLVLFGSSATGVKKPGDIDIAVFLTRAAQAKTFVDFEKQNELTQAVADFLQESSDKLDIVFPGKETAPLLAYHIARDGKLLFGLENDFMRFRMHAVKVYYDNAKFRVAREQYLKQAYAG